MDLQRLFETQKVLRDRIGYNEPDRFNKLVLALLVELGECANEWRGFKFWSKDQDPRIEAKCPHCKGKGYYEYFDAFEMFESQYSTEPCTDCEGTGFLKKQNPLLEEYVDGLHFVLELGIELNMDNLSWFVKENIRNWGHSTTSQFNDIFERVIEVKNCDFDEPEEYEDLVYDYLSLGIMLGFTWEQIEQAYFEKNKVNHQRQDSGY